jgi:hypothetical protein
MAGGQPGGLWLVGVPGPSELGPPTWSALGGGQDIPIRPREGRRYMQRSVLPLVGDGTASLVESLALPRGLSARVRHQAAGSSPLNVTRACLDRTGDLSLLRRKENALPSNLRATDAAWVAVSSLTRILSGHRLCRSFSGTKVL